MQRYLLLCLLGLHACAWGVQGAVYKPSAPLLVNAFAGGNESWFQFPEAARGSNYSMPSITSRPRLAIAVSGGGMRAATVGLGMLRGLHSLGVTDGARYVSSNSGGSWLNAAFSFQQKVSSAWPRPRSCTQLHLDTQCSRALRTCVTMSPAQHV